MDDCVRLRVVFEDRRILSKSQKSEGLKRSWLLLKSQHQTISDLSSYLFHIFNLHRSCPRGVIISMDGFVLPPFESTCILKDKDVIRVERKGRKSCEVIEEGGTNLIEEGEIVEKQPVLTCVPVLQDVEFEKETGGYQSEPEKEADNQETDSYQSEAEEDEDNHLHHSLLLEKSFSGNVVSKKRKASMKLQSSKRKKKHSRITQDIENDTQMEQNMSSNNDGLRHVKSIDKKGKVDVKSKPKRSSTSRSAGRNNDIVETLSSSKRSGKFQENGAACADVPHTPDGTKKVPSRSARRKKAKRLWLRELKKELHQSQSPEKNMLESYKHQDQNQNGEAGDEMAADDEIVPIVIRPGHIRFEPLGKDQAVQQCVISTETFRWDGITNKKKSPKWGEEKFAPCRRNGYTDSNKECSETMTNGKVEPPKDPIDFDKLAPFGSLPKEGDVIAYRLLELSSTFTPELSSFRVGKTSRFDPKSNTILLIPVPEYPITFEQQPDEDACARQSSNSLYKEDQSLEIKFSSLIDIRIVKYGNSVPAKALTGWGNYAPVSNEVTLSAVAPSNNGTQTQAPAPENERNVWDELAEALNAKRELVIHENVWSIRNSSTRPCSYRALKTSSLGPKMPFRRARK
ncbi:hypothetical protein U1Q18_021339 [Sarracenia purpurea var. burkii]